MRHETVVHPGVQHAFRARRVARRRRFTVPRPARCRRGRRGTVRDSFTCDVLARGDLGKDGIWSPRSAEGRGRSRSLVTEALTESTGHLEAGRGRPGRAVVHGRGGGGHPGSGPGGEPAPPRSSAHRVVPRRPRRRDTRLVRPRRQPHRPDARRRVPASNGTSHTSTYRNSGP